MLHNLAKLLSEQHQAESLTIRLSKTHQGPKLHARPCTCILLTNDSWFQINEDSPRDMLPGTSLREEGGKGVITAHELVRRHVSVGLDAMLQAVQLPTGIANLAAGLTNVD